MGRSGSPFSRCPYAGHKTSYCAIHLVCWKWLQKVNPIESIYNPYTDCNFSANDTSTPYNFGALGGVVSSISPLWARIWGKNRSILTGGNSAIFGRQECCVFLFIQVQSKQRTVKCYTATSETAGFVDCPFRWLTPGSTRRHEPFGKNLDVVAPFLLVDTWG